MRKLLNSAIKISMTLIALPTLIVYAVGFPGSSSFFTDNTRSLSFVLGDGLQMQGAYILEEVEFVPDRALAEPVNEDTNETPAEKAPPTTEVVTPADDTPTADGTAADGDEQQEADLAETEDDGQSAESAVATSGE